MWIVVYLLKLHYYIKSIIPILHSWKNDFAYI